MILMEVSGVYSNSKSVYPQVVLKEKDGNTYLPIAIGRFEAAAISMAQKDRKPTRPISYDLAQSILEAVNGRVEKVAITNLHEGTYFAEVHLCNEEGERTVLDSRPSDAIALALRLGAPIFASPEVIEEAGYVRSQQAEAPEVLASTTVLSRVEEGLVRQKVALEDPAADNQNSLINPADRSVDQLELLKRRLERAVAEEAYEEAARLRDEIHVFDSQSNNENGQLRENESPSVP